MWDTVSSVVINMSYTASFVIAVVLLARLLLMRAPKIFSYLLWIVVLFRLACPISFHSQMSVLVLGDYVEASLHGPKEQLNSRLWETQAGNRQYRFSEEKIKDTETAIYDAKPWQAKSRESFRSFLTNAWLAGTAGMMSYFLLSLLRLHKRLVGAVRLRDNIYLTDYIEAPFVFGLFGAKIYLPSGLAPAEQEYIIMHEQIHIRRKDHLVKILAYFALSVHWFNPLVWLAFYLSGKDMEMSCDEAVLKKTGGDIRAEYSESLLRLASGRKMFKGTLAAFGEGGTGSRIKHVMGYKKPAVTVLAFAAFVLAAIFVSAGSNPKKDEGNGSTQLSISKIEAANRLKDFLESTGRWDSGNVIENNNYKFGIIQMAGDEKVYGFDIRCNDNSKTAPGRLAAMYAVSYSGNTIYRYDMADGNYYIEDGYPQAADGPGNHSRNHKKARELSFLKLDCAFIKNMSGDTVEVDPAEYVDMDDLERVEELRLDEFYDMPDGYYIHNPDKDTVAWKLDENTQFIFIDWGENFVQSDTDRYVITKDREVFKKHLGTYGPKPRMPFFFEVEDGVVKMVVEEPFA